MAKKEFPKWAVDIAEHIESYYNDCDEEFRPNTDCIAEIILDKLAEDDNLSKVIGYYFQLLCHLEWQAHHLRGWVKAQKDAPDQIRKIAEAESNG